MKLAKKMIIAAAVLPIALGSASAFAFGGKGGGHKGGNDFGGKCGGFDGKIMRQLDLTDEQHTELRKMREQAREDRQGQRGEGFADMQAHREKMQSLMLAENFDKAAAQELANEMVAKQAEKRVQRMEKQHQMLSVLTPEQKTKLAELQNEQAAKCQQRFEQRQQ